MAHRVDAALHLTMSASASTTASTGSTNSTSDGPSWEAEASYTGVRVLVSAVSFSVLLLFNLLISSTIIRVQQLRSHARFVLLFHLLLSALLYLATSTVFHYQEHVRARPGRAACAAMVSLLMASGSHILLTLTAMALDRYWAVCHPMRYTLSRLTARHWPWALGALTWFAALSIPLFVLGKGPPVDGDEEKCGRERLRQGELPKVVFIGVCTTLILYRWVKVPPPPSSSCDRRREWLSEEATGLLPGFTSQGKSGFISSLPQSELNQMTALRTEGTFGI